MDAEERTAFEFMNQVKKPAHYDIGNVDVIGFAEMQFAKEEVKGFHRINIIKYVTRYDRKNGVDDLIKAADYLNKLIELEKQTVSDNKERSEGEVMELTTVQEYDFVTFEKALLAFREGKKIWVHDKKTGERIDWFSKVLDHSQRNVSPSFAEMLYCKWSIE